MALHQCARFCNNPHIVHERAVRHVVKYLASTSTYVDLTDGNRQLNTCGVVYRTDVEKGTECYVDSDFAGGWAQAYDDIV